jgi:hypothetical protein
MGYAVVIADLVASRRLAARAQFQRRLKAVLHGVTTRAGRALASPYTLTLGDEFQAVYRDATQAFADIMSIQAQIAPVQARFAVATGPLATSINAVQAIGMDGPAFHRARALLERLKDERRLFGVQTTDAGEWTLPSGTLAVFSGITEGWMPKRFEVFAGLLSGLSGPELAKKTDITVRAVNKNIRAADLDEWKRILDEIARQLNEEIKAR